MLDKNNEVFFGEYCKTCKYKNYSEMDSPCAECIAEPVNLYSHKPVKWEGADGIFSGPPPRPDHAYQRAVKYVPERRKDKEKAIARLNIDAEYTGNKIQSLDGEVTEDQYPSATAVKKALDSKIDVPQVAKVGEVLTVEEIGDNGKPKKWKTQKVETEPPDWNENDPTKPGYIENRTHYFKVTKTEIGSILFKATSSSALVMENPEDTKLVRAGITEVAREHSNIVEAVVNGNLYKFYVGITMGVTTLMGVVDDSNGWAYDGPAGMNQQFIIGENASLVVGNTYDVMFYWRNEFCKTLDEMYFPKTIFTQNNSPVKFGTNKYGDIIESTIQGIGTVAQGAYSHAEGAYTKALGDCSHAEGNSTKAQKSFSHAEGFMTTANGETAHAEGSSTQANNHSAHAEGDYTIASGKNSHAEGGYTIASAKEQHAQGKYNIEDTVSAHIVGNGESDSKRSNAHTLDWEGNAWFAGNVYVGSTSGTNKDEGSVRLATEDQLTFCVRVLIGPTKNDDGTITYSASFPALFVYGEIFKGRPVAPGNSVECCLIPIDEDNGPLTVLNYTGMSIDQNSDGNTVLTVRFSSYVSGKHISAEIKDTISGFQTDNEELLSTVVTVTEEPVVTEVFSLPLDDSDFITKGSDGLVPGPTLQERDKFLRADGKWVDLLFCYGDWNEVYKSLIKGEIRRIFTIGSYNNTQSGTPETLGVLYYNGTNGPKLNYTMFGHDGVIYDIDFNRQYKTFSSIALTNKPLPAPATAQVGQIVKVKAVDADGKITETEAVDMPSVDYIIQSSTAGSTKKFKITVDDSGTISATEITETPA